MLAIITGGDDSRDESRPAGAGLATDCQSQNPTSRESYAGKEPAIDKQKNSHLIPLCERFKRENREVERGFLVIKVSLYEPWSLNEQHTN